MTDASAATRGAASPDLWEVRKTPNALAGHYAAFRVEERILLTGHSHQAWPDVGFAAEQQACRDAALDEDRKQERALEKVERLRRGFAALLEDPDGDVTLAPNTRTVVARFLSALRLQDRPKLVTTDAEFPTVRSQLDRMAEEGNAELVAVPGYPAWGMVERLVAAVDDRTAAVLVSAVLHQRGVIVPWLDRLAEACALHGAELLVDAYHALGAIPFPLRSLRLDGAFVVGGGCNYLQLGRGNCFLRTPPGRRLPLEGTSVDPTAQYRGAAVMDFFEEHGLTPDFLREISEHQVGLLARTFRGLALDPRIAHLDETVRMEDRGGFLALTTPDAERLCERLAERGVHTDYFGATLRFGPAPYLSDSQIQAAMATLGEVATR